MTLQTLLQSLEEEFDNKFPCIDSSCDGRGVIANQIAEDEWEPQQCQFCYENRLPVKEFFQQRERRILESVIAEIEKISPGGGRLFDLFRDKEAQKSPFTYPKESDKGQMQRNWFTNGYMQAKIHILSDLKSSLTALLASK